MYVHGRIFFLAPWPLYIRVHAMCAPLLRHVRTSTSTSMYVHVRDQNDNATYASTRWVPTVRHFLACEDVAGGSQQSGGRIVFFARKHFLACEDVAGMSQKSGGNIFFAKYSAPSGGSQLSGGGIIIFRVIRRHFLAAAVDPAVSLSTYSPTSDGSRSLTTLTTLRREHHDGGRWRGLGRGRRGAGEDAAVDAHA